MLKVQEYLQSKGFSDLYQELGIKTSVDREVSPQLTTLNYDMLGSPKTDPIVGECRGLIVSTEAPYNVIARTFDRFFNDNEALNINSNIDYNDIEVIEKVDGSLVSLFYNPFEKRWNIATRNTVNGRKAITSDRTSMIAIILEGMGIDVSDLDCQVPEDEYFLDANVYQELISRLDDHITSTNAFGVNFTYICEVVSPKNRVITEYKDVKTYLLAIRNKDSGEYLGLDHVKLIAEETELFSLPKRYTVANKEELHALVNELNKSSNTLLEGVVIFDRKNKIFAKVKNNVYLIAHHRYSTKNGKVELYDKDIADLVARYEEDDFLSFYSYLKEDFQPYIDNRESFIVQLQQDLDKAHEAIDNGATQKEIAQMIQDPTSKSAIFLAIKKDIRKAKVLFSEMSIKLRLKIVE